MLKALRPKIARGIPFKREAELDEKKKEAKPTNNLQVAIYRDPSKLLYYPSPPTTVTETPKESEKAIAKTAVKVKRKKKTKTPKATNRSSKKKRKTRTTFGNSAHETNDFHSIDGRRRINGKSQQEEIEARRAERKALEKKEKKRNSSKKKGTSTT